MGGRHALHTIAQVAPWHPASGDAGPPGARGPVGKRRHQAPPDAAARGGEDGRGTDSRRQCAWAHAGGGWLSIDDRWTFDLWWLPEPVTRSYYRVDPGDGRRMTLVS